MDSQIPTVVQQTQAEVKQLRREAAFKRIPVSQAIEDIKRYTVDHCQDDHLLIGFHGKHQNPFREKSSCALF